jgi:TolB-like protein
MSREGYLKYVARRYHGMEISKSEARKILRRQRKGASSYSTHSHSVHTQYAADPIRSKYGAEAERYRLKTYHGKKISRANQEWKKAATPVRSRFSNRGNRVLESSHPNTPSSGVQFSRKARVNSAVQNKQNSRSVYCSECGKYHTGNHYHGTWCRSCNQYHATDLHSRVHNGCTQCTASSVHSSQTCIHCTPKTKKRVVTKKLRSTSSHLIRPVQTHKIVERSSYKSFRYRKNRVAIFPFQNRNVEKVPAGRVEDEIARQLSRKGYEVVTLPMDVYGDSLGNSKESYREMAERLGVEYIVSGDVLKYSDYKKMRLAGLVLGGILTGVHGYGDVAIDSHVYSLSANRLMAKQARERTRKQVLGVLGGTGDLIGLSLERAVNKLYAFM